MLNTGEWLAADEVVFFYFWQVIIDLLPHGIVAIHPAVVSFNKTGILIFTNEVFVFEPFVAIARAAVNALQITNRPQTNINRSRKILDRTPSGAVLSIKALVIG